MDQAIKEKAIALLKEQGPDRLLKEHGWISGDRFCAGGAIMLAYKGGYVYDDILIKNVGLEYSQLNKLIAVNDYSSFDELIEYMESL